MKKYVVLFIFFAVFSYSYIFIDGNNYHQHSLVLEESETLSNAYAEGFHPIDDDKQKITLEKFEIFLFLALVITFTVHYTAQFIRRLGLLNPVFYQSNYVILSLSPKNK